MTEQAQMQTDVNGEQQVVTIEMITGIEMDNIGEKRGFDSTPVGVFEWRIVGAEITPLTYDEKDKRTKQKTGNQITVPIVQLALEVIACRQLQDTTLNIDDMAGLRHNERFFLGNLSEGLARANAFLADIDSDRGATFGESLEQAVGHEFVGATALSRDGQYVNIDLNAVSPMENQGTPVAADSPEAAENAASPAIKLG